MDANEMADELAKVPIEIFGKVRMVDVRVMLRQQQAEIDALKSRIHDAMAWMDVKEWNSVDREILLEIFQGKGQEK